MKPNRWKKLRAGFTLAETLIAVAILALVSSACVTLSATILGTKAEMIEVGKCQSLASTAVMTIADEIRYGQNIRCDGDKIVIDSMNFGAGTHFAAEGGKIVAKNNGKEPYALLPEKYYGTLTVSKLTLERVNLAAAPEEGAEAEADEAASVAVQYAVKISITVNGSGGSLYSTEMTVPALNGIQ